MANDRQGIFNNESGATGCELSLAAHNILELAGGCFAGKNPEVSMQAVNTMQNDSNISTPMFA